MQILARDKEQNDEEIWIGLIGDLAYCISIKRPKEVVISTKLVDLSNQTEGLGDNKYLNSVHGIENCHDSHEHA